MSDAPTFDQVETVEYIEGCASYVLTRNPSTGEKEYRAMVRKADGTPVVIQTPPFKRATDALEHAMKIANGSQKEC